MVAIKKSELRRGRLGCQLGFVVLRRSDGLFDIGYWLVDEGAHIVWFSAVPACAVSWRLMLIRSGWYGSNSCSYV